MTSLRIASAVLALSALGSVACGGDDGGAAGSAGSGGAGGSGGTVTGGAGGSGGSAGSGGGASCAEAPGFPSSDTDHAIEEVTGTVLDLAGAPAAGVPAQVCGLDVCLYGSTTDQGVVCNPDKTSGLCIPGILPDAGTTFKRPAFKYGDGIGYVRFAQLLPTNVSKYALGDVVTAKLPDPAQGVALAGGSSATSNGVTLTLAAGTKIKFDELTFDTEELQKFRAVELPMAKAPPAVDSAAGFEILVGTTPIESDFCPHATLSVPNTPGWPAGTEVEFWIHGVTASEGWWAPYGGWAKVSGGKVSADGKSVVTNDGEGVPSLSVFGVKKK
ncbi:MAG: hypothetical protein IPM35_01250 [Myxococcales bacterium]|nr:hypothetical protein [Myxococcales bacterium]